jgi:hypothetical protein
VTHELRLSREIGEECADGHFYRLKPGPRPTELRIFEDY